METNEKTARQQKSLSTLLCVRTQIKLVDFFATERRIYIVMEYAECGDLLSYVNSFYARGPVGKDGQKPPPRPGMTEKHAKDIFRDIMAAVHHVHSNNVSHRSVMSLVRWRSVNHSLLYGDLVI